MNKRGGGGSRAMARRLRPTYPPLPSISGGGRKRSSRNNTWSPLRVVLIREGDDMTISKSRHNEQCLDKGAMVISPSSSHT